jgi:hypothetical protein
MDQDRFEVGASPEGQTQLRCAVCGPVGEASCAAVSLTELNSRAAAHQCGPALPPDSWLRAAHVLRDALGHVVPSGCVPELDPLARALGAALTAVWPELKEAARAENGGGQR